MSERPITINRDNVDILGDGVATGSLSAMNLVSTSRVIVTYGSVAPTPLTNGLLWLDTTSTIPILKIYYASAWHSFGAVYS